MEELENNITAHRELIAALLEIQFFMRAMREHTEVIRNGLDSTEVRFFRDAEQLATRLGALEERVNGLSKKSSAVAIEEAIEESLALVSELKDFKRELTVLIAECRVLAIIPADLVDHIRREADFFLGTLYWVHGEPTPTRESIGLPDGGKRALTVPRFLIPDYPNQLEEISLEESLFWLRIHKEHAQTLTLYFRPEVQDTLLQATKRQLRRISDVYEEALEVNRRQAGLERLLRRSSLVMNNWEIFLRGVRERVLSCKVPTGQINLWPFLGEHMIREVEYFREVLEIAREER